MNCLCLSNFNYLIVIFIICISESYGSSSKDFGRDHLLALAFLRRLDSEGTQKEWLTDIRCSKILLAGFVCHLGNELLLSNGCQSLKSSSYPGRFVLHTIQDHIETLPAASERLAQVVFSPGFDELYKGFQQCMDLKFGLCLFFVVMDEPSIRYLLL